MFRVRETAPFTHFQLAAFLDQRKVGNRMFFGGNLLRQPVFVQLKKDRPLAFRVVGNTDGADTIMRQALFLGTYPGLTLSMIDYEVETIREYIKSF
jgi:CDP-6-deoxy-D-xylo-4-hexulose-3-dehydrase